MAEFTLFPRRSTRAVLSTLLALTFFILLFKYTSSANEDQRYNFTEQQAEAEDLGNSSDPDPALCPPSPTLATIDSKYAFATLLAGYYQGHADDEVENDQYFVAVRILAYQFLHAPETRTTHGYPFIVLVTPEVSEAKRERLRMDGAIIVETPPFEVASWFQIPNVQWRSVLAKMRVLELTQFERVLLLDGDTQLTRPLDDIFDDPATALQTTSANPEGINKDEGPLPSTYGFAGTSQLDENHHFPPTEEGDLVSKGTYLNGGFVVMKPCLELLSYYVSLMQTPMKHFEPYLPEQHLWNYAHRGEYKGGNMPWAHLNLTWNVQAANLKDIEGGTASIHEKFWNPGKQELLPYLSTWRWRMKGFWEGVEARAGDGCTVR